METLEGWRMEKRFGSESSAVPSCVAAGCYKPYSCLAGLLASSRRMDSILPDLNPESTTLTCWHLHCGIF